MSGKYTKRSRMKVRLIRLENQAMMLIAMVKRLQVPAHGHGPCQLCHGGYADGAGMDRLGPLSALPHPVLVHQSQAPLPELRPGLRPAVLLQVHATAALRDH